jgi:hypothetical protein
MTQMHVAAKMNWPARSARPPHVPGRPGSSVITTASKAPTSASQKTPRRLAEQASPRWTAASVCGGEAKSWSLVGAGLLEDEGGLEIFEEGGAATLRWLGEKWRVSGDSGVESAVCAT